MIPCYWQGYEFKLVTFDMSHSLSNVTNLFNVFQMLITTKNINI